MEQTKSDIIFNTPTDNFFIKGIAPAEYKETRRKIRESSRPPKKKIYRNMMKMLQECYLIGSLKYGNNFIV